MQIQFTYPWVLVLLWLVPLVGIAGLAAWRIKARSLEKLLAAPMRAKLSPPAQAPRFYWQLALVLCGLLLALIAAARPQWGMREETVMQRGRDLVIALDVSRSMLAPDVHPSRLQRSKADIQDLLGELRGDRAALIAFRGKAVQLCPLTTDYAYLEQALAETGPQAAPRGETDIGDAIAKALDAFESDAGAYQAVILISDGEDLAGHARAAAERAKEKGAVIYTVGIGDAQGSKIPSSARPNEYMTYQGREVVSKLEHETLKSIAEITGGAYVPVGLANVKLGTLYRDHLSKLTARDIEESIRRRYINRYQWFLLPAVLAFLASALLSKGRFGKRIKTPPPFPGAARAAPLAGAIVAVVGLAHLMNAAALAAPETRGRDPQTGAHAAASAARPPGSSMTNSQIPDAPSTNNVPAKPGQAGRIGARRAQALYRLGKYREAADAYLQAMPGQTAALQNHCLYNAACALYRAGQYQAAAARFLELAARPSADSANAYYNQGCALFRLADQARADGTNQPPDIYPSHLERSGRAFQQALRLNANDSDARSSLSVVTNLLPAARREAKIKTMLARWRGTPPPQLADNLLANQRKLVDDLAAALTNAAPARIEQMESLSARQRENADLLIPLEIGLSESMAGTGASSTSAPQQAAQVEQHIEALRNVLQEAAEKMRDLDPDAYRPAVAAESGIYTLWKGMAQFPQLLREDLFRQTNAIAMTTSVLGRAAEVELPAIRHQQGEALELTGLFIDRFSQAVPPGGTAAGQTKAPPGAASTNAPDESGKITAETRAEILDLAKQALTLQGTVLPQIESTNLAAALPGQIRAYELLKEIEKLLPKNKDQDSQHQNQEQNQEDRRQQEQNQEQDKDQDQPRENQQQPKPQDQPKETPPAQPPQPQQDKPQTPDVQPENADKDKEMTPEQARALLEKAQQRDKERRDKLRRDQYIPPSPVEKDW